MNDATLLIDHQTKRPAPRGGVLALGNFDGVHLGHREVIATAKKQALKMGLKAHALTFEPHPYAMFKKDSGPFLLTPRVMKNRFLLEAGADEIITLHFSKSFADKTPQEFIHHVLIEGCAAKHVVVGFDFVFGHGRGGDREALRKTLAPLGIGVTEVPPFRDAGGEVISSSRIRAALRRGDVAQAMTLLGRPFTIQGKVQKGDQRGRTLDFPTANIDLGDITRPAYGVYAVMARREGTALWQAGVANIGVRPSVGGKREGLEFFLFDFDKAMYGESLYGQEWEVELLHFMRPEKAFGTLDALKAQIAQDVAGAKKLLSVMNPESTGWSPPRLEGEEMKT